MPILTNVEQKKKQPTLNKTVDGLTERTEKIVDAQERITSIQGKLVEDMKDHKGLLIYGFMVLMIMVATMILMVASMLIEARKEQKDIIYIEKGQEKSLGINPPF